MNMETNAFGAETSASVWRKSEEDELVEIRCAQRVAISGSLEQLLLASRPDRV